MSRSEKTTASAAVTGEFTTVGPVRLGGASAYWALDRDEWKAVLRSTGREFKSDEVSNLAAVVTLRIVLAIVPSLIAAVAIAAQVISPDDISSLIASAQDLIPGSAKDFVDDSLSTALEKLRDDGRFALPISIGAGLFAASGAASSLVAALNKAYDVKEGRGFVGQRIAAFGVVGALALAMIGMFVAIVLGPTLLELLVPAEIYNSPARLLITAGRYLAAIAILMLFFSFTFWFGPNRDRPPLRFMTPGAVLGVTLWLLLSFLFGLYVSLSGSYAATYGVFAGVIVMLVWLQYSFIVLLMAAELDHEIQLHLEQRASEHAGQASTPENPDIDFDVVSPAMPRHPGLVPSHPSGEDPRAQPGEGAVSGGRLTQPVLLGAARDTPGARVATQLWNRIRG